MSVTVLDQVEVGIVERPQEPLRVLDGNFEAVPGGNLLEDTLPQLLGRNGRVQDETSNLGKEGHLFVCGSGRCCTPLIELPSRARGRFLEGAVVEIDHLIDQID